MKNYIQLVLVLLCTCAQVLSWPWDVETVKELDLNKYTGRWFEAYGSFVSKQTFERDGVCTFAEYGVRPDGKISVMNAQRVHSPSGAYGNVTGYAEVVDPKVPGKLKVYFPGSPGGSYWVMKLGPLNKAGQYSYSVVTSNLKSFLWILVRDHDDYMKNHDDEVQKYVKEKGFTWFWNKPRKTYQGKDCNYPASV